jgi:hypothetical protein
MDLIIINDVVDFDKWPTCGQYFKQSTTPFMVLTIAFYSKLHMVLTFYCWCNYLPNKDVDVI